MSISRTFVLIATQSFVLLTYTVLLDYPILMIIDLLQKVCLVLSKNVEKVFTSGV